MVGHTAQGHQVEIREELRQDFQVVEARDESRYPKSMGTLDPATLQAVGALLQMALGHLGQLETYTWWTGGEDWRSGLGLGFTAHTACGFLREWKHLWKF